MNNEVKNNKMDKLVNRAWADMEEKLDIAMPTARQSKKRIFPLLAILLFAIAAGGAGIILMIQLSDLSKSDEQKIQHTSVDYAQINQPENEPASSISDNLNAASTNEITPITSSGEQKTPGTVSSDLQSKSATGTKQNNGLVQFDAIDAKPEFVFSSKAAGTSNPTGYTAVDPDGKTINILSGPGQHLYSSPDFLTVKYFHVKPAGQMDQFTRPEEILPLSFGKNTAPVLCNHTVQFHSGILSENITGFSGLEFGLSYNRYYSSGFFLQTGLNYSWMDKKYFSNALLRTGLFGYKALPSANASGDWVERRYDYELKNSDIRNNEIAYEYVVGLVDHLHYLNIPLHLGYRFNRLKIFGGVSFSWLMYGSNAVRDLSEQYFNTIILSEEVLFNKQLLNRFDLSPQMGLEFNLWKGLGIYAYYNHGLVEIARAESASKLENVAFSDNYINESSVARIDKNRYFVIGFNYQLDLCNMK